MWEVLLISTSSSSCTSDVLDSGAVKGVAGCWMVEAVERLRWLLVVVEEGRLSEELGLGMKRSSRRSLAVGRGGSLVGIPVRNSIPAAAKHMNWSVVARRNWPQAPGPLPMFRYLEGGRTVMGVMVDLERLMVVVVELQLQGRRCLDGSLRFWSNEWWAF